MAKTNYAFEKRKKELGKKKKREEKLQRKAGVEAPQVKEAMPQQAPKEEGAR